MSFSVSEYWTLIGADEARVLQEALLKWSQVELEVSHVTGCYRVATQSISQCL